MVPKLSDLRIFVAETDGGVYEFQIRQSGVTTTLSMTESEIITALDLLQREEDVASEDDECAYTERWSDAVSGGGLYCDWVKVDNATKTPVLRVRRHDQTVVVLTPFVGFTLVQRMQQTLDSVGAARKGVAHA